MKIIKGIEEEIIFFRPLVFNEITYTKFTGFNVITQEDFDSARGIVCVFLNQNKK